MLYNHKIYISKYIYKYIMYFKDNSRFTIFANTKFK